MASCSPCCAVTCEGVHHHEEGVHHYEEGVNHCEEGVNHLPHRRDVALVADEDLVDRLRRVRLDVAHLPKEGVHHCEEG